MNIHNYLSDDGLAVLALCSAFGLKEAHGGADVEPFKLSEWNEFEKRLSSSSLKNPASLQGHSAEVLAKNLFIVPQEAERIVQLLQRSGHLALYLESLFSHGMWAVTRMDELYPSRLRDTCK